MHVQVDNAQLADAIASSASFEIILLVSQPPTLEELFLAEYDVSTPVRNAQMPAPRRPGGLVVSTLTAGDTTGSTQAALARRGNLEPLARSWTQLRFMARRRTGSGARVGGLVRRLRRRLRGQRRRPARHPEDLQSYATVAQATAGSRRSPVPGTASTTRPRAPS